MERSQVGESHSVATIIVLRRCPIVSRDPRGHSVPSVELRVDFSTDPILSSPPFRALGRRGERERERDSRVGRLEDAVQQLVHARDAESSV